MKAVSQGISRRDFLGHSARAAGVLAIAGAAARGEKAGGNPFAYDFERFAKTDPKLVGYERVGRFSCPSPEPRRLALGEGRVYLATKTGVEILTREGARQDTLSLSGPVRCVAVAEDGTVYAGSRERIEVFDSKGQHTATWEISGKRPWLSGLCVGAQAVFAADSGNRLVWRYDRSGKLLGRIGEKNKERNVPGLIVPSPYLDAQLGKDGLLRVNNPGRHCVEVYTPEGDLELSWGKPSAAVEGFCGCCNPIALTLLPDGRCVTCEKGLPRVKVYSSENRFECVVAGPEAFPQNARAGSAHDLSDGSMGGLDAAVDDQGRVYVLDLVSREVTVLSRKAERA